MTAMQNANVARPMMALRPTRPAIHETLCDGRVIHSATVCGIYVESTSRVAVESVLAAQEIG